MSNFLAYLLLLQALALIGWGFWRKNRIYQFPFLLGWVSLLIVVPTFFSERMASLPRDAVTATGIMTFLCIGASWLGFVHRPRPAWVRSEGLPGNDHRLFLGGLAISLVSLVAYARMGMMTGGGVVGLFTTEGAYEADWSGSMVVLKLISSFIYGGIAMMLIAALRRPSFLRFAALVGVSIAPLATVFLLGRRGETLTFVLMLLIVFHLRKGWTLPRWAFAIGAPLFLVAVIVAPQYREHSQLGGDWSKIKSIDLNKALLDFFEDGAVEILGGVYIIGAQAQTGHYRFGTDYYNGIIRSFVPRFLVGRELKESLQFAPNQRDIATVNQYSWQRHYYNFPFGPSVAFEQFSYLGCLIYYLIGMVMGTLWERARRGSIYGHVFYVTLVSKAMMTLLTDQSALITYTIYMGAFVGIPLWWAAQPSKRRFPRFRHRRLTEARMHPMAGILPPKKGLPGLLER